jgi:hypothetical protein
MSRREATSPAAPTLRALPSVVLAMLFRSAGVLAVLAVPVVSSLGPVDAGAPGDRADRHGSSAWKAAYSERYPGCVPSVLWPAGEDPVAVITRSPDGTIARVGLDPQQRPLQALPDGALAIGVCR